MLVARHRSVFPLLLTGAGCLVAACRGGDSWVDVPRAAPSDARAQRNLTLSAATSDAGLDLGPPATSDKDAGDAAAWRPEAEECRPYTNAVLELDGYEDDFPEPGPDLAMTWQPDAPGVYVATLTSTGPTRASLQLLHGDCGGTPIGPIQGLEGAWPGFTFVAEPDQQYTFVIEGQAETETVHLAIELGCEHVDDMHCVRADDDGEPECGVRYAVEEGTDHMRCEPMHAPGDVDARCPDTTFRDDLAEGCCKPNGVCGHLDPELGCHDLAHADWAWSPPLEFYCDDRAVPEPPDYFECSEDACETALDCCAHPTYGNASCIEGWCVPAQG